MAATIHDFNGVISVTVPTGGMTEGTVLDIGTLICLPLETKSAAATGRVLVLNAIVPKMIKGVTKEAGTGFAWTLGQNLYWDAAGDRYTSSSTGNVLAAIAAAAATAAATTGDIIPIPAVAAY
jgi:hypothetical protein